MALATYQSLCIDARDAEAAARFWGAQLGLEPGPRGHGVWSLDDPDGEPRVWLNPVPEPVTVKNRIHLDVNAESLRTALDAGATTVDDSQRWTVLRDPDGQEFCVFVRTEPVTRRLYELVWDAGDSADDSHRIAAWWAEALGGRLDRDQAEGYSWVEDIVDAPFESLVFQPVPEPKTTKNRVHIDVDTTDLDTLLAHGARVLREKDDEIGWHVLADPDGNEFCAFTPA
ncbi:VOC family protein [Nocardioides sp. LHG3406-4]|uniref:VOC family protein n=1 Tax=Nocardioides sp. LHG3406-4 TaxID=2804575 RepID=UPI003CF6CAF3